jgi:hypothetical protein
VRCAKPKLRVANSVPGHATRVVVVWVVVGVVVNVLYVWLDWRSKGTLCILRNSVFPL